MEVAACVVASYNRRTMPKTKTKTVPTSFRLTETAATLLAACASQGGISQAAVLETAIREYAKRRGVTLADAQPKEGE